MSAFILFMVAESTLDKNWLIRCCLKTSNNCNSCFITITCFAVIEELLSTGEFDKLERDEDESEHSIELHLPYIAKVMER